MAAESIFSLFDSKSSSITGLASTAINAKLPDGLKKNVTATENLTMSIDDLARRIESLKIQGYVNSLSQIPKNPVFQKNPSDYRAISSPERLVKLQTKEAGFLNTIRENKTNKQGIDFYGKESVRSYGQTALFNLFSDSPISSRAKVATYNRKDKPEMEASSGLATMFNAIRSNQTPKAAKSLTLGINSMVKGSVKMMAFATAMKAVNAITQPFESIGNTFGSLFSVLSSGFMPLVTDINKQILSWMPEFINGANWLRESYSNFKGWLDERGNDWANFVTNWNTFWNLSDDWTNFTTGWDAFWNGKSGNSSWDGFVSGWNTFWGVNMGGNKALADLQSSWNSLFGEGSAWAGFTRSWDMFWSGNSTNQGWNNFVSAVQKSMSEFNNFIVNLPNMIISSLTSAGETIKNSIKNWWEGLWD